MGTAALSCGRRFACVSQACSEGDMARISSLFRVRSKFRSQPKHHRSLRPLLESLERRDLLAGFTTLEDKPLVVSDPNLAKIVIVSNPAHGTVSLTDLGGFVYK